MIIDDGAPRRTPVRVQEIPMEDLAALMAIPPSDPSRGWRRLDDTRPAPDGAASTAYRSLHRRAQSIRLGRVGYLNRLGRWGARVQFLEIDGERHVGLWVRFEGADGTRWEEQP